MTTKLFSWFHQNCKFSKQTSDINIPQPGESSDSPSKFRHDSAPFTKRMTLDQILSDVSDIVYYNDVLNDVKNNNYEWSVTKKVVEYAKYLKNNPDSINNLPPIIVIDGKLDDGSHRISAIYLLREHMDKNNTFWESVRLPVMFYNTSDIDN